jgi:hypothetical protein
MSRRKANKPVEDDPLSNTDNAVLSFVQGRELCSYGIIGISHFACTRWKENAMAEVKLTASSSNRQEGAARNQGASTLYGRKEPTKQQEGSGPRSFPRIIGRCFGAPYTTQ